MVGERSAQGQASAERSGCFVNFLETIPRVALPHHVAVFPGEDAGFNSIIARTPSGRDLLRDAEAAGAIRTVRELAMRDMDDTQPHQVRKKESVWARLAGMRAAGHLAPADGHSRTTGRAEARRMPGRTEIIDPPGVHAPADGCAAHCRMSS